VPRGGPISPGLIYRSAHLPPARRRWTCWCQACPPTAARP